MSSPSRKDLGFHSASSSSCSSPRAGKDMSTQELLLRSGGGLQGLIWSKYGIEEGKESPFQKRRREKSGGRRVNSEPLNDIEAAKRKAEAEKASQAEHQERTRSQSACEVVVRNKIGEEGGPTIEVVDVLSKMKLDPGAELEISPPSPEAERVASSEKPPSSSDDSPRSPAYLHIIVSPRPLSRAT